MLRKAASFGAAFFFDAMAFVRVVASLFTCVHGSIVRMFQVKPGRRVTKV